MGGRQREGRVTAGFVSARSVDEALSALQSGARPVAGGTDLVVGARQGKAALPESIVAIHRIEELRGVNVSDGRLRLGALATHADIATDSTVHERFTALADACSIVGSRATRAHGTVGGNLMNASPAMEVGGPFQVSVPPDGTGSCYARLEYRRQMEIAIVGVTAAVTLDGGSITRARVAITALAPTIVLVPEAEKALLGSDGGAASVGEAAAAAAAAARPISDVRGSADYRRAMAEVLARRVIDAAVRRAQGGEVPVPASDALFGAASGAP
jgi:CO/xanthine dehydrogenase FAD-binding subunit